MQEEKKNYKSIEKSIWAEHLGDPCCGVSNAKTKQWRVKIFDAHSQQTLKKTGKNMK